MSRVVSNVVEAALRVLQLSRGDSKPVTGNHGLGLDEAYEKFHQKSLDLFTSEEAKAKGIYYLNREVRTVAHYRTAAARPYPSVFMAIQPIPSTPATLAVPIRGVRTSLGDGSSTKRLRRHLGNALASQR